MKKSINYIPKEFLKNNLKENFNDDFYITSTNIKNITNKKNDKIWLILALLIILDII